MNHLNSIFVLSIFTLGICITNFSYGQSPNLNIDSHWDKYYDEHPSGIAEHYQAIDFINIVNTVGFVPTRKEFGGNVGLLKRILLGLSVNDLRQMRIDGDYYSRTYKHNDYFELYNLSYKRIDQTTWDKYAPYLIPLMSIDGIMSLKS